MKGSAVLKTVRRSVALPGQLIRDVTAVAPPEVSHNLNRLVTIALQEFVARRRQRDFEAAMARMAEDPAIRAENARIGRAFKGAERDGLT